MNEQNLDVKVDEQYQGEQIEEQYQEENIVSEFWAFLKERKKFWLMPIVLIMLMLGALIVFTQGSAIAPFIYALF